MPWMLYTSREKVVEAGGWDENFLFGCCWEDNDFVGRLALVCDKINCDWGAIAWHQSHYQPAYEKTQEIIDANKRNANYINTKWAGSIPWGPVDVQSFQMLKGRDEKTGNFCLTFEDFKGVKDRVIQATLSPFVSTLDWAKQ
jgi:GT2 family glycosyltransferase